jgi:hypothetical protein
LQPTNIKSTKMILICIIVLNILVIWFLDRVSIRVSITPLVLHSSSEPITETQS